MVVKIISKLCLFNVTIIFSLFVLLISFASFSSYLDNNTVFAQIESKYNNNSLESIKNSAYNNDTVNKANDSHNKILSITINSTKFKYYNDDILEIVGNVYDNTLNLTKKTVLSITSIFKETSVFHEPKQPVTLQKTTIPVIDGSYNFTQYLYKPGFYNISVSDKDDDNNDVWFVIEAKNKLFSSTFIILYIAICLLVSYGIITWLAVRDKQNKKTNNNQSGQVECSSSAGDIDNISIESSKFKYEIIRFFILSAISLIPLVGFLVTDVEIGKFSFIGLVMKDTQNSNDTQQDKRNVQWVINIGGSVLNNYSNGITIPFYVVALGWLGGYLRYLHKTVSKIRILYEENNNEENKMELNTNLWLHRKRHETYLSKHEYNLLPLFLYSSFEELAEILLAPLLAIAVWLLMNIAGTVDIFTASLISFSVGLITKDVIYRIIEFSKSTIGQQRQPSDKPKETADKTKETADKTKEA